jgi:hypothetical protein
MSGAFEVKFDNEPSELNARQMDIVALKASDLSNSEIAVKLGINVRTVEKNIAIPAVKQAIREAREQIWEQTIHLLVKESVGSVKAMAAIRDTGEAECRQLMAATKLLDFAFRTRGSEETERRLEYLESLLLGIGNEQD